jgi:hypothetical protein
MPINDANYSVRIGEIKKRFPKQFIAQFGNPFLVTTTQKNVVKLAYGKDGSGNTLFVMKKILNSISITSITIQLNMVL